MKKYIPAFKNSICMVDYEYIGEDKNGNPIGFHNPHNAKHFDSKNEAKNWFHSVCSHDQELYVVSAETHFKKWEKAERDGYIYRKLPKIDQKHNYSYNPTKHTKYDVLKWQIDDAKNPDSVPYEVYETWPELFIMFNCLWTVNLYEDDTINFAMKVDTATSFNEWKNELDLISDHITHTDNAGNKIIEIFDRFCGEGGDFVSFIFNENADYYAIKDRFGTKITGTIEEVFNYWKSERYYE